jgi:pimeloyl-ACP methyl ester carboxylesterase
VLVAVAVLVVTPPGPRAQSTDAANYCDRAATQFDPADVPRAGSEPARTRGVRERRISVEGISTPVLESGPRGRGEAVVFLHGVLGSSQDFVDLLPRVGRTGQRAIAFDLPGFGRAGEAWSFPATFAAYTRWFGKALTRLGVRRARLVLHDIGGPIALQWVAANPRRTGRIVLIDSGVLLGFVPHPVHVTWATPGRGEEFQRSLTRKLLSTTLAPQAGERALPRSFRDRLYDDLDRETRCAVLRFFRSAASSAIDPAVPTAQAARLRRTFGSRLPVLVIWGQKDVFLRVPMAARQREAFPAARVELLARSGHWPFADDPAAVRRLVLPFLRRPGDRVRGRG